MIIIRWHRSYDGGLVFGLVNKKYFITRIKMLSTDMLSLKLRNYCLSYMHYKYKMSLDQTTTKRD